MNGDLISRSALLKSIEETDWYHINDHGDLAHGANSKLHTPLYKADDIYMALDNAPSLDAVEVIRCKDCFYWMKAKVNRSGGLVCPKSGMEIVATDHCSKAERRKCHYDR